MSTSAASRRLWMLAVTLAALAAWTYARAAMGAAVPVALGSLPWTLGPWHGEPAPPLDPDVARVLAADTYLRRYYANDRSAIEMDIAYYSRPRAGASMHSPLNCLPGNGWQVLEARTASVEANVRATRQVFATRRLLIGRGLQRIAMAYWFQNRSGITATEYEQRLRLLADGLRGRATDAALVRVMTPVGLQATSGEKAVHAFTQQLIPVVRQYFE